MEFSIEVEYEAKKAAADVSVVLRIVSESGTIVFTSSDADTPILDWEVRKLD